MRSNADLKKLFENDQNERRSGKISSSEEEKKRRVDAELILSEITSPTKEDYYYAAVIFNHGDSIDDYKKANDYAKKSLDIGLFQPNYINLPGLQDNRWLYAATFDRLQDKQGLPQQYGTQRHGRGDKIDQLIEVKGYPIDRDKINKARAKLGIDSLDIEEEKIINPSRIQRGLAPFPSQKSKGEDENQKIKKLSK